MKELHNVIKYLKKSNNAEEAYLGLFYDDEHEGHISYAKANKEGLRLFASELLEASLENDEKEQYTFLGDWNHKSSDFHLSHIILSKKMRSEFESIENKEFKQTWKEVLGGYLIGASIIFILISILVGSITIIKWMI